MRKWTNKLRFLMCKNWVVVGLLCFAMCVAGLGVESAQADRSSDEIYAFGDGPIEVLVFTDYYCHPCQEMETYLERTLPRLLQLGAKISFVDKPINRATPVYSKYFLFAAKKAATFEAVLRCRRVLFDIAKADLVSSESELVQSIRDNHVEMAFFDVQPIFDRWVALITKYEINSTPTCVITRPATLPEIVSGSEEIPKILDQLTKEMGGTP